MDESVTLCSKNPLWLYQGFSFSASCSPSGSFPSPAFLVSKAKSSRSIGVAPSTVSSLPILCSSSKPFISWQPAQPYCLISACPLSHSSGLSMNDAASYCGGDDKEKR